LAAHKEFDKYFFLNGQNSEQNVLQWNITSVYQFFRQKCSAKTETFSAQTEKFFAKTE
jgi:hypothetical protein